MELVRNSNVSQLTDKLLSKLHLITPLRLLIAYMNM